LRDVREAITFDNLQSLRVGNLACDYQDSSHQVRANFLDLGDYFLSLQFRAPEVQKDSVEAFFLQHSQRLAATVGHIAVATLARKKDEEDVADGRFVFDD
jgi:hypothetical protein